MGQACSNHVTFGHLRDDVLSMPIPPSSGSTADMPEKLPTLQATLQMFDVPLLFTGGQSSWLQIQGSRVQSLERPDISESSVSGTGSNSASLG
uniref:Uncharacterized protein n=1 Tax=Timema monikensis TaxID=170555 RepID=A0A7R9EHU3_9NEOP|nr:unnamed protein product [Timema monikensis]